jgi:hypothetical protein
VFKLRHLARGVNCKQASRLLSQAQERRLSPREWMRLRLHIHWCVTCRRVERQMEFLRKAMRRWGD